MAKSEDRDEALRPVAHREQCVVNGLESRLSGGAWCRGLLAHAEQGQEAEGADQDEDPFDDPGSNRSQSHGAAVRAKDGVQADGDSRAGGGPDELDQRRPHDLGVQVGQRGEVVGVLQGRAQGDHAEDARRRAHDEQDSHGDRVSSVGLHPARLPARVPERPTRGTDVPRRPAAASRGGTSPPAVMGCRTCCRASSSIPPGGPGGGRLPARSQGPEVFVPTQPAAIRGHLGATPKLARNFRYNGVAFGCRRSWGW